MFLSFLDILVTNSTFFRIEKDELNAIVQKFIFDRNFLSLQKSLMINQSFI